MCVYLYIHNKYTVCINKYMIVHIYIYNVNKTFVLDAINSLTALIILHYIFITKIKMLYKEIVCQPCFVYFTLC